MEDFQSSDRFDSMPYFLARVRFVSLTPTICMLCVDAIPAWRYDDGRHQLPSRAWHLGALCQDLRQPGPLLPGADTFTFVKHFWGDVRTLAVSLTGGPVKKRVASIKISSNSKRFPFWANVFRKQSFCDQSSPNFRV
eukprot:1184903-Prorocentrum_minimum.AAC.3